jgi:hypothetical protein
VLREYRKIGYREVARPVDEKDFSTLRIPIPLRMVELQIHRHLAANEVDFFKQSKRHSQILEGKETRVPYHVSNCGAGTSSNGFQAPQE